MILREFDYEGHTSDVKVVAYGNTPKRVLEALMLGILNLIYDVDKVEPKEQREIEFYAEDILPVIFELGTRILDAFYIDKFAIGDLRVKSLRRTRKNDKKLWYVRVGLFGEQYDPKKHGAKKEVKAITYHEMDFRKIRKSYWFASCVVDV